MMKFDEALYFVPSVRQILPSAGSADAAPSLLTDGSKGYAASVTLPSSGKMKALWIRQTAQIVRYGPVNMREGREERSAMEEEGRTTLITSKCCYDQRANTYPIICNSDQCCC